MKEYARPLVADIVEKIMSDAERIAREREQLQLVHQRAIERSDRQGGTTSPAATDPSVTSP